MLQSSRNRPDYFVLADFERFEELAAESDAQMKQHLVEFFPRALQQPKYHKLVRFCCAIYLMKKYSMVQVNQRCNASALLTLLDTVLT